MESVVKIKTIHFQVFLHTILVHIVWATLWNSEHYLKREHSLIKPYHASGINIPYWDFIGSTMVTNNYIRLTPDVQSKAGAVWNNIPCLSHNWELQVHFKIHGKGKDLFGDGMAIWYAKEPLVAGPVFGSKDYFSGLGVFLDTYANHIKSKHHHEHPYISAMVNNATMHYDHDHDGSHTELAGCEAKFRNAQHETYLSVHYEHETLTVSTDTEGKSTWKVCFKIKEVRLPTGYFFGVSATTGELSDNHDVLSVKLFELESLEDDGSEDRTKISPSAPMPDPQQDREERYVPVASSTMSGTKMFLICLFSLLGLCTFGIGGLMLYQKRQECRKKRLY